MSCTLTYPKREGQAMQDDEKPQQSEWKVAEKRREQAEEKRAVVED